jgi:hypothetical protein
MPKGRRQQDDVDRSGGIEDPADFCIPGTFQVERHVRGKWVCRSCETLIQAPVPPQVIDRGSRRLDFWPTCW